MSTKSRNSLYGREIASANERAASARRHADRLACIAWTKTMLGFGGPAQPSPMVGDALNCGRQYLEVKCHGCGEHQTIDLTIVRRPKDTTPIHELERWLHCKQCSERRSYRYKRAKLVALRFDPITARKVAGHRCGGRENGKNGPTSS